MGRFSLNFCTMLENPISPFSLFWFSLPLHSQTVFVRDREGLDADHDWEAGFLRQSEWIVGQEVKTVGPGEWMAGSAPPPPSDMLSPF